MKRFLFVITLLFVILNVFAQEQESKLLGTIKEFHQALVKKDIRLVNEQTDKVLSYGHSNGWVETKEDMIKNLETGVLQYHSFKEDSMVVSINGNTANARFIADINVTLRGNTGNYHLKVLEVWVKKKKQWVLFARQAVR